MAKSFNSKLKRPGYAVPFDDSGHDVVIDKAVFENVRETEREKISVIDILLRLKTFCIRNQFMEKRLMYIRK